MHTGPQINVVTCILIDNIGWGMLLMHLGGLATTQQKVKKVK